MTEIEIKAHVADPEKTEKLIAQIAVFKSESNKNDTYWKKESTPNEKPVKIRIREESGQTFVTYKRKELQGLIEVNDEQEFSISDGSAFEVLLRDLGFFPYISKNKKTKSYQFTSAEGTAVTIELSELIGLGYFIEIEILAENPDLNETEKAQLILKETLSLCGINESEIESRYYTDLLMSSLECHEPKM